MELVIGTSAGDTSDRLIYNSDSTGINAQGQIASLDSGLSLGASDFVVI